MVSLQQPHNAGTSTARKPAGHTRQAWLLALASASVLATGCADMSPTQQGTAKGAGIGAVSGAIISAATGGKAGTGALIGGAVGAVAGNIWSKHMEEKRQAMEAATKGTGVEVSRTPDNQLRVNVPSDISFDVGRATIRPELRSVLNQFASGLGNTMQVRIVGHTDSTGSDAINNPLSVDRAESVKDYLVDRGVAGNRIVTEGRGSRQPVADNATADGRARNRRVEIFLSDQQG